MSFHFNLLQTCKRRCQFKARTVVIAILVLVFGGLLLFNVAKAVLVKKFFASFQPPPVTISAIEAKNEEWQPILQTVGSLKAVRGVDMTAEVAGTIAKIYVKSGEEVREGQALLDLDDSIDQQSLANSQSQLDLNEALFKRQQMLIKEHAISKQDFDQASANLKQAQANAKKEQELIAQKHIVAPFAGQLGILQISVGQYVTPGTSIVSLQAMDPLYLDFSLPEQHLAELKLGEKVNLQLDTYPKQKFSGEITAINSKINPNTRNIDLQATIPNPDKKLLPGLFGHVEVMLNKAALVVTVPVTAVTSSLYGDSVFIVQKKKSADGKQTELVAHEQVVHLGETRNKKIVILQGVKAGDLVVTSGQLKLHDGAVVKIDNKIEL
ncbi:MAG TPA: efflux RND transporter periplasmic adaptor subunit [Coxiellaceae bacterium]|nr:efflux RND transporter periplasmic adaptor subunit [Coxiellaceae bacterium]